MISQKQIQANRMNALRSTGPSVLDKFLRYESHIQRNLLKNMHELERLQAWRQNCPVLVPFVPASKHPKTVPKPKNPSRPRIYIYI